MTESPYQVLLYYLYTPIEDPEAFRDSHRALCEELGLLGRIIIGKEGLNGTLSGTTENCQKYIEVMHGDPVTDKTEFKVDPAEEHLFPRLSIKAREEIVTLGLGEDDFSPLECTATHLNAEEWYEAMQDPNSVLIDIRNDYEHELGHFKGALLPTVSSFRDTPEWIRENRDKLEGKKIMTYCTGGIRCEKFSGFLLKEGFDDVVQLDGGIVKYSKDEKTQGKDFEGQMYVFDSRVGIPVNQVNPSVVGVCRFCDESSERYINCTNLSCNTQHFCCEKCEEKTGGYCCDECRVEWEAHLKEKAEKQEKAVKEREAKRQLLFKQRKATSLKASVEAKQKQLEAFVKEIEFLKQGAAEAKAAAAEAQTEFDKEFGA